MRSFSNLWYWIALAVLWSTASRWIVGVPYDMVQRAQRQGGQAEVDLHDLVRINVNRFTYVLDQSGLWITGFTMAVLTSLATLGFWYSFEFAQAVLFLAVPASIVGAINALSARKIKRTNLAGEALYRLLSRQRLVVQILGVVSIFVTAVYGMAKNILVTGPL